MGQPLLVPLVSLGDVNALLVAYYCRDPKAYFFMFLLFKRLVVPVDFSRLFFSAGGSVGDIAIES